jgi:hypothetical protein
LVLLHQVQVNVRLYLEISVDLLEHFPAV